MNRSHLAKINSKLWLLFVAVYLLFYIQFGLNQAQVFTLVNLSILASYTIYLAIIKHLKNNSTWLLAGTVQGQQKGTGAIIICDSFVSCIYGPEFSMVYHVLTLTLTLVLVLWSTYLLRALNMK